MNQDALLALIRAGLWEEDVRLSIYGRIEYSIIYKLAEEQSVIGLIAAGLEHVVDVTPPKGHALAFVRATLQLEQRNLLMNNFIAELAEKFDEREIFVLLVKGQGVAQCYERPLWRACGDVDLFLDSYNYKNATQFLQEKGTLVSKETLKNKKRLNAEFEVGEWLVELHGTQHANLSNRMDIVLDQIQNLVLSQKKVRVWRNGKTEIKLPAETEDVVFVFAHILQHLFHGGIGLRQICDWCRLLWTYRETIDKMVLEAYIRKMGIMSEWKVFSCIAVNRLGMPAEAMPFYDESYLKKADYLLAFILEVGNFGHNRELGYTMNQPPIARKINITVKQLKDNIRLSKVFPVDAPRFFLKFFVDGMKNIALK